MPSCSISSPTTTSSELLKRRSRGISKVADAASSHTRIHGTLVEVGGVGLLLLGRSGIGKSECALELIMRGHRLVADDVVLVGKGEDQGVVGWSPELIRH